jgi:Tol biopolymer transport system component/TRAP-type C4-dicarboxylate transport system substrate-binding protein
VAVEQPGARPDAARRLHADPAASDKLGRQQSHHPTLCDLGRQRGAPSEPDELEFIDQVKTLSQGSITIEPIWDAGSGTSDGFEKGVIQLVRKGKFDLGLASSRTWNTQNITSFQVLQAPFLITNDALSEAVATSDVVTRMLDSLSTAGMVGLTLWPEGLRHPFSVVPDKPLLSPQDFVGAQIRTGPSDVAYQLMKALGARPMFEDGGYQGADSGLLQAATLNGQPVATGNVTFYPKYQVLFANAAAFDRLSAEQRTILRQAAAAAQKKAIAGHPREVAAATAWCAAGHTIVLASDAQVAAFEQAAQPIFDQLAKDPSNAAFIAAIRDLKAHTAPAPGATACAPTATAKPASAPTANAPMTSTTSVNLPRIVFVSHPDGNTTNGDSNAEIYSMNADGSGQTRLTNNHYWDNQPTVSSDGKRIAFVASPVAPDDGAQIYTMNVDGSDVIRLTNNAGTDDLPIFSPDGKQIVFFSDRDGNVEIYVMNADGSGQTNLTHNPALDEYPSWSPDGKQIIFDSTRDGGAGNREIRDSNGEIYVMNADGSGQTRLTHDGGHDGRALWSPDGKKIVFETNRDGDDELYMMNADGTGQTHLTNNPNRDIMPAWSLDGKQIAFTSTRDDGDYELYVMNADGSHPTRLTHNPGDDIWAAWLPAK